MFGSSRHGGSRKAHVKFWIVQAVTLNSSDADGLRAKPRSQILHNLVANHVSLEKEAGTLPETYPFLGQVQALRGS